MISNNRFKIYLSKKVDADVKRLSRGKNLRVDPTANKSGAN